MVTANLINYLGRIQGGFDPARLATDILTPQDLARLNIEGYAVNTAANNVAAIYAQSNTEESIERFNETIIKQIDKQDPDASALLIDGRNLYPFIDCKNRHKLLEYCGENLTKMRGLQSMLQEQSDSALTSADQIITQACSKAIELSATLTTTAAPTTPPLPLSLPSFQQSPDY